MPTSDVDLARRCAEAMYADDLASQRLGIRIEEVSPGRATARMVITDFMINGHGICHGGYLVLLADTAFAFACNTYNRRTVAAGCDVAFLAPARLGDELTAVAVERVRSGRNGIYDVTVWRAASDTTGDTDTPTARATAAADISEDGNATVVVEFRGRSREIPGTLV